MTLSNPGRIVWRDYVTDGVPSSGANEPYKPDIRRWSAEIETLLSGDVNRAGTPYKYSTTTTTTADPGAGFFRLNNASLALVTEIAISGTDNLGLSTASWIAGWDDSTTLLNRGSVILRALDGDADALYRVVGANIDGAGFYRIAVSYVGHSGTFANNDAIGVLFVPTGDRGGNNYELSVWLPGDALPAGGEVILRHGFKTSVTYPSNFSGSQISSKVAAPEDAVYTVWKMADIDDLVGTQVGTATIAETEKSATFSSSETTFDDGEYLELRAPDPPVATLSDVTGNIVGSQAL